MFVSLCLGSMAPPSSERQRSMDSSLSSEMSMSTHNFAGKQYHQPPQQQIQLMQQLKQGSGPGAPALAPGASQSSQQYPLQTTLSGPNQLVKRTSSTQSRATCSGSGQYKKSSLSNQKISIKLGPLSDRDSAIVVLNFVQKTGRTRVITSGVFVLFCMLFLHEMFVFFVFFAFS